LVNVHNDQENLRKQKLALATAQKDLQLQKTQQELELSKKQKSTVEELTNLKRDKKKLLEEKERMRSMADTYSKLQSENLKLKTELEALKAEMTDKTNKLVKRFHLNLVF
jgi:hypothetical protein